MATKHKLFTVKNVTKHIRGFTETDGGQIMLEPGQEATKVRLSDGEKKNVLSTGYFSVDGKGGEEPKEPETVEPLPGGTGTATDKQDDLDKMSTEDLRATVEALTGKAPAKRTSRKKLLEMARAA